MIDLSKCLTGLPQTEKKSHWISLSGKLEAIVGNYFVSREGYPDEWHLLMVYYDAGIDAYMESVDLIPENLVAFVESDYKWALVLEAHMGKFQKDTEEYGMRYIPVSSFHEEILHCSEVSELPEAFADIVWIDDDFMNDDSIPFDYEAFEVIDEGIPYLNPKHFSVVQLCRIMEEGM